MTTARLFIATALSILGATATAITSEPPSATTSTCLPPNALCGLEARWSGGYFGRKQDLATPEQCLEFCRADRSWGECRSFSFSSSGTCWIHNAPAADVVPGPGPGAGIWIWDKECWDCGALGPIEDVPTRTTSAVTATATCLSPTAQCEVEATWKGDEVVGSWGRYVGGVEDGPYACWEVCTDARRPPRCKAFSWDPMEGVCLFYDHTVDESHDAAPGSGVWLWDIDCWRCGVSGYM